MPPSQDRWLPPHHWQPRSPVLAWPAKTRPAPGQQIQAGSAGAASRPQPGRTPADSCTCSCVWPGPRAACASFLEVDKYVVRAGVIEGLAGGQGPLRALLQPVACSRTASAELAAVLPLPCRQYQLAHASQPAGGRTPPCLHQGAAQPGLRQAHPGACLEPGRSCWTPRQTPRRPPRCRPH